MTKLLIEVECGEETCGECGQLFEEAGRLWCHVFINKFGAIQQIQSRINGRGHRCPACLAAEQKAKGARP